MPDKVNVPLLGPTPKGGVLAGGLAVVGVAGYLIYKHYTTPKGVPPGGSAYGYGTSAYGYGMAPAYGYGYVPYGSSGFGGGGGSYPYPYGPGPGSYGYGNQPITTNSQWGQAAESALGSNGTDSIAAAIAKYLAGAPITQDQALKVQEAEALVGPPPKAGLLGYPPKMHITGQHGGQNGHHKPPPHKTTTITIHENTTLRQIARNRGWSAAFLREVEALTHLHADSHLHRGQKIKIPAGKVS
jgi:hypothetical protein